MNNLNIKASKYTPEINLDFSSGIMDISGKSYPENTFEYYAPVINWINEYLKVTTNKKTIFNLDLEYLNSSSLKAYFDIFDILKMVNQKKNKISINWIFDTDNDISQETGEDFIADFVNLEILLVEKN